MKRTYIHRGASKFYDSEVKKSDDEELTQYPPVIVERQGSIETTGGIGAKDRRDEHQRVTNQVPTEYQPDINQVPTEYQPDNNRVTTGYQPDNNRVTVKGQSMGYPGNNRVTTGLQPGNNRVTTGYQPDNNRVTNSPFSILVGLQRKLVLLIYESSRSSGGQISLPLSLDHLRLSTGSPSGTIKTAIHRLKEKHILITQESKKCRGGWSRYKLADSTYLELQNLHPDNNRITTGYQPDNNQVTTGYQPDNNRVSNGVTIGVTQPSSSSSIKQQQNLETTTTTTDAELNTWSLDALDFSFLADIGFGRSQAKQLRSLDIPFDVVQSSLSHFEFELHHTVSGKTMRNPLALFMKCMRQNGCWEAPDELRKRHSHFRDRFETTQYKMPIEDEQSYGQNDEFGLSADQ
jgi:hypothetical protein